MSRYIDYLTNNNDIYFPFTMTQAVIHTDGNPLTTWMHSVDIHNHDIRYASASHNHDTRYSLVNHVHNTYSQINHVHNYAASSIPGGPSNATLKLQNPFTLSITGVGTGSETIDGSKDVVINLNMTHEHDTSYIRRDGSDEIYVELNSDQAFSIVGNGGNPRIVFCDADDKTTIAYIGFKLGCISIGYDSNEVTISSDGVYYNGEKMASESFVMDQIANLLNSI